MRFYDRFRVRCVAVLCLLASLAFGVPYEIRVWKNGYGTAYGCAYRSASESFERFSQDFDLKAVTYFTGGAQATYCSSPDGRCPLWTDANYTHFRHKCVSGSAGVIGKRKVKNQWLAHNYPSALHTVTNVITFPLFQCKRCMMGFGEHDEGIIFNSTLCSSDTDLLPIWVWYSDKVNNFAPIYNEAGNQVIGGDFTIDPAKMPPGAIPSGDDKNGDWAFDGETEPHWEWIPGKEPPMSAETLAGYLQGIQNSLDAMAENAGGGANPPPDGFWANLGDNMKAWVQSGVTPFQDAVQAGFDDLIAAMPETPEPPEPVDLGPVISAIHGVNGSVQVVGGKVDAVGTKIENLASDVSAFRAERMARGIEQKAFEESMLSVVSGSVSEEDVTEMPVDPDIQSMLDNIDEQAQSANENNAMALQKLNDYKDGANTAHADRVSKIQNFMGAAVGSWANLGRVPIEDFDASFNVKAVHIPIKFELSKLDYFWLKIRAIEVVMLWVYFGFRVMDLVAQFFGGSKK